MKKKIYISCLIGVLIFINTMNSSYALTDTEVQTRILQTQGTVPSGIPAAPIGFDQKGFIGEIIANIFNAAGLIKNQFITAFQDIEGFFSNNIPRWDGQKFVEGTITDNGSSVGIATDTPTTLLQVGNSINIGEGGIIGDPAVGPDVQFGGVGVISSEDSSRVYIDSDNDTIGSFMILKGGNTLTDPGTTQLLRVLNDGNVGISTASPSERLDVNGKIRMRTQTQSSDSDDTVVTKGYVDSTVAGSSISCNLETTLISSTCSSSGTSPTCPSGYDATSPVTTDFCYDDKYSRSIMCGRVACN